MNPIDVHPAKAFAGVLAPAPPVVYVDGRIEPALQAQEWSVLPAPRFGWARLALAQPGRIGSPLPLPPIGSRIELRLGKDVVFDGLAVRQVLELGSEVEQLALEAEDLLAVRLSRALTGRWQREDGTAVFFPAGRLVFNDEDAGLASPAPSLVLGRLCHLFSAATGQPWSVAQILQYLLVAHVEAGIWGPSQAELESLAGGVYPPPIDLQGLTLAEAVMKTAALAGLEVKGCAHLVNGTLYRGLVFYRPGQTGRKHNVRLARLDKSSTLRAVTSGRAES